MVGALVLVAAALAAAAAWRFRDVLFLRRRRKREMFARACARAAALGRLLVVVGDPASGAPWERWVLHPLLAPAYGYGDVCLDVSGCPGAPARVQTNARGTELCEALASMAADEFVVFESGTLEYLRRLPEVVAHLRRVAGGNANIFTVRPRGTTKTYPDRHGTFRRQWNVVSAPPGEPFVYRRA
jgi:hypothetical protein